MKNYSSNNEYRKREKPSLVAIRTTLVQAVGQLDLSGTDQTVTEALCIIDAVIDSSLRGKSISSNKAFLLGKAKAANTEED
jgi:hypothetical protein